MGTTISIHLPGCLPEHVYDIATEDPTLVLRALAEEIESDWDAHECDEESDTCDACAEFLDAHTAVHNGAMSVQANGLWYEAQPSEEG